MPHIDEMPGQAAGDQEQGVDADVVAIAGVARRETFSGDRDPAQPIFVESPGGRIFGGALLYFDKGQRAPTAGDKVDFAAGYAGSARENPPALQP